MIGLKGKLSFSHGNEYKSWVEHVDGPDSADVTDLSFRFAQQDPRQFLASLGRRAGPLNVS